MFINKKTVDSETRKKLERGSVKSDLSPDIPALCDMLNSLIFPDGGLFLSKLGISFKKQFEALNDILLSHLPALHSRSKEPNDSANAIDACVKLFQNLTPQQRVDFMLATFNYNYNYSEETTEHKSVLEYILARSPDLTIALLLGEKLYEIQIGRDNWVHLLLKDKFISRESILQIIFKVLSNLPLTTCQKLLTTEDLDGNTPVHLVAMTLNVKLIEFMLEKLKKTKYSPKPNLENLYPRDLAMLAGIEDIFNEKLREDDLKSIWSLFDNSEFILRSTIIKPKWEHVTIDKLPAPEEIEVPRSESDTIHSLLTTLNKFPNVSEKRSSWGSVQQSTENFLGSRLSSKPMQVHEYNFNVVIPPEDLDYHFIVTSVKDDDFRKLACGQPNYMEDKDTAGFSCSVIDNKTEFCGVYGIILSVPQETILGTFPKDIQSNHNVHYYIQRLQEQVYLASLEEKVSADQRPVYPHNHPILLNEDGTECARFESVEEILRTTNLPDADDYNEILVAGRKVCPGAYGKPVGVIVDSSYLNTLINKPYLTPQELTFLTSLKNATLPIVVVAPKSDRLRQIENASRKTQIDNIPVLFPQIMSDFFKASICYKNSCSSKNEKQQALHWLGLINICQKNIFRLIDLSIEVILLRSETASSIKKIITDMSLNISAPDTIEQAVDFSSQQQQNNNNQRQNNNNDDVNHNKDDISFVAPHTRQQTQSSLFSAYHLHQQQRLALTQPTDQPNEADLDEKWEELDLRGKVQIYLANSNNNNNSDGITKTQCDLWWNSKTTTPDQKRQAFENFDEKNVSPKKYYL